MLAPKTNFIEKQKVPAAIGQAYKNAFYNNKNVIGLKDAFYRKQKSACGNKARLKTLSVEKKR